MTISINIPTHVPTGAASSVSPLDPGAPASSCGAPSVAPPKGEGMRGLGQKHKNARSGILKKCKDLVPRGKSQEKESSLPRPLQDEEVSNKDQFTPFTEEQAASLFDIWESVPAEQKVEAGQKFDQLKTSMEACKSDDERQMALQNAVASMQELVPQMPAASQPGMREKLSNLLGKIKSTPVKGDEKSGATAKSGGNEGPEKKDPSSEFPSFSDMKNMSKEELLEQQQRQSWEAMMIQVVLTNMQILTEIVKKGTSIAAGVIQ